MVGCAYINPRDVFDHFFLTYVRITVVDLEQNFEQKRKAWDPQKPVETLFKKIQEFADLSEAVGVAIDHSKQVNVGYANIFATCNFMSACHGWNEKKKVNKKWANFKVHFSETHYQQN
jgi:hypothetical protein